MPIVTRGSPAQFRVIKSNARFIGFFAGRQFGKTWTAQARIIRRCLSQPGFQYWYVTPFYSQCHEEYEKLIERDDFRRHIKRAKMQPFPQIWLHNGSRIGFRSFEKPRTLRGRGVHELWIDEIQDIKQEEFWPVVRPLIGVRLGTLIVSGQFRGKNWYYHEFYVKGQDQTQSAYESFAFATHESLVWQTPAHRAELEHTKATIPDFVWRQEYLCEPCSNPAAVWLADQIDAICAPNEFTRTNRILPCQFDGKRYAPSSNRPYVMGLDLGRVADHTAITIVDAQSGQCVYAERLPLRMAHPDMAVYVGKIAQQYNQCGVVIDSTGGAAGGQANQDQHVRYYRAQLPNLHEFKWNPSNKKPIIERLTLAIQEKWIHIPGEFAGLLDEIRVYEAKYVNGFWTFGGPNGVHDDFVQSIAMAIWGAKSGWWPINNAYRGML